MADTKNEYKNEEHKDTLNATGELNWSGSQQGDGVKVEVKEKKQSDSAAETAGSASQETHKTGSSATHVSEASKAEPVEEASAPVADDSVEEGSSGRPVVSFVAGLIIGALLTSILI